MERHAGNPEKAARELIDAANRAGGKDNVTVVIVEGEQFHGARRWKQPLRRGQDSLAAAAFWAFAIGAALGAGGARWFLHKPLPPPPVLEPRVLAVGRGRLSRISAGAWPRRGPATRWK